MKMNNYILSLMKADIEDRQDLIIRLKPYGLKDKVNQLIADCNEKVQWYKEFKGKI